MKPDLSTMIVGLRAENICARDRPPGRLDRAHVHRIAAGEIRRPSYETVARLEKLPCAFASGPTAGVTRNS